MCCERAWHSDGSENASCVQSENSSSISRSMMAFSIFNCHRTSFACSDFLSFLFFLLLFRFKDGIALLFMVYASILDCRYTHNRSRIPIECNSNFPHDLPNSNNISGHKVDLYSVRMHISMHLLIE